MKKYCVDTSGISNPLETTPEDIHQSAWVRIKECISNGDLAVTKEIYDEMIHIGGSVGECIKASAAQLVLEIGEGNWDYATYVKEAARMQVEYAKYISENNGGKSGTVCLNDISIIALAKTLNLPLVSMESAVNNPTSTRRRIPDICKIERINHMFFIDFCRAEGFKF